MSDSTDKDLPDEQQLDEYLRGGSAVSRQYRELRSADVPAELDRLVLRQAQEAVKAKPAKSRAWVRWTGPLALAASAVLVVSIVIESGVHEETLLDAPASAPVEMKVQQDVAEQATGAAVEKRASKANEAEDKAVAGAASDASVVHVVPVQPPAPDVYFSPPPAAFAPEEPIPPQERALAIQPSAPLPMPAPQVERLRPHQQVATPPPAELDRTEQVDVTARRSSGAPVLTPAPVSTQVPMREVEPSFEETVVTGMRRREQKPTVGPRNTVVAPANNAADQQDESRDYSDPEQWLRDIRQLRKANKHDEADREWRRFRYVYPNYEVAEEDSARGAQR